MPSNDIIPLSELPVGNDGNLPEHVDVAPSPPSASDDAELRQAILHASTVPPQPTRWNNYETRSPKQVLLDYQRGQSDIIPLNQLPMDDTSDIIPLNQLPTGHEAATSDIIPLSQLPVDDRSSDQVSIPQPYHVGIKDLVGGAAGIADIAAQAVTIPVAGLAALGQSAGEGDMGLGNIVKHAQENLQKASDFNPSKLADWIGGRAYEKTKGYEFTQAPFEWLSEKTGQLGEKTLKATGSPALATIADIGTQFAAMGVVGKIGGTVIKAPFRERLDLKKNPEVVESIRKALTGEVGDTLDLVGYKGRPGEQPAPGQTWQGKFEEMIKGGRSKADILNFLADADHDQLEGGSAHLKTLAQIYRKRADEFGFDLTPMESSAMVKETGAEGFANWVNDTINMATDTASGKMSAETFMHEVGHNLTSSMLEIWRQVKQGYWEDLNGAKVAPVDLATLPDSVKKIIPIIDDISKIHQFAIDEIAKQNKWDNKTFRDFLQDKADKNADPIMLYDMIMKAKHDSRAFYGLTSLGEFTTEALHGKRFKEVLAGLDAKPLGLKEVGPQGKFKNLWSVAVEGVKKLLLGINPSSAASIAFDRAMGLVDAGTPAMRAMHFEDAYPSAIAVKGGYKLFPETSGPRPSMTNTVLRAQEDAQRMTALQEKKASLDRSSQVRLYTLADILKKMDNADEFETRARLIDPSQSWQDMITEKKDFMLENKDEIINEFGKDRYFENLSESERLLTADPRSLADFMDNHIERVAAKYGLTKADAKLKSQDDIFDDLTFVLGQHQLRIMKAKGTRKLGGEIVKFLGEKGEFYNSMGAKLYDIAARRMQEYSDLSYTGKKNVMAMAIFWDSLEGRNTLRAMGLQWATEDMLKQGRHGIVDGLSDAEAKAYLGIADAMDFLHNLTNQALLKQGKEPIPQIPGYMPHFFEGAYRVLVEEVDGANRHVVLVKGFQTRWGAESFVKGLNSGKYDYEGKKLRPQIDEESGHPFHIVERNYRSEGMTQSIAETLGAYKNISMLDPRSVARIEKLERDANRGTIKHILERSDIGGYIGDPTNNMGFHNGVLSHLRIDPYNNRILKMYDLYAKNVTEYYKNTMFIDEVAGPLADMIPLKGGDSIYGSYLQHAKALKEYVGEYTSNFTGENFNHLYRWIEDEIRPMLKWAGLDPELGQKFLLASRNFLSLAKLRGNIGFYAGNFLQPLHMISILSYANEMFRQGGHNIEMHAPLKAFVKAFGPQDAEALDALQTVRQEHYVDPRLEYELRKKANNPVMDVFHKATLGNANLVIEGGAREQSFLIAYHFFKERYGKGPEAIMAAKQAMDMINVNYERANRPLMYQNFGMVGQAMSPFSVFRNAYIGNNLLMLQAMKSGKFHPKAMVPFLTYQSIYMMMAGAVGLVFAEEYDQLVKLWNEVMPEARMPRVEELALKAQKKFGMSDAFTYGAISNWTKKVPGLEEGVNIGPSMRASGLDTTITTALSPFLDALAKLGGLGLKAGAYATGIGGQGVSESDLYPALENVIPAPLKSILEHKRSPSQRVASKTTDVEGYVSRTPAGWHAMDVFGKLSVDEAKRRRIQATINENQKYDNAQLRDLVRKAVDANEGVSQMPASEAQQRAMQFPGMTSQEWDKMVEDEITKRRTTARERSAGQTGRDAAAEARLRREMGGY